MTLTTFLIINNVCSNSTIVAKYCDFVKFASSKKEKWIQMKLSKISTSEDEFDFELLRSEIDCIL